MYLFTHGPVCMGCILGCMHSGGMRGYVHADTGRGRPERAA